MDLFYFKIEILVIQEEMLPLCSDELLNLHAYYPYCKTNVYSNHLAARPPSPAELYFLFFSIAGLIHHFKVHFYSSVVISLIHRASQPVVPQ